MHCTLHLTTSCPMRCDYCYARPHDRGRMTEEVLERAIGFARAISPGADTGIIFFGGEPLLRKDLIVKAVDVCTTLRKKENAHFHFKVTTNGLLLDDAFLTFAHEKGIAIALSIDGTQRAHDTHRTTAAGEPTFEKISPTIDSLLRRQPYASALMVVSPETVGWYAESVEYLLGRGFKYLMVSLNHSGAWTEGKLAELRKQYGMLASLYEKLTLDEKKFYFSPFEVKLATHIMGDMAQCQKCALAQRQVSIAPDGTIYPCVQLVQDESDDRQFAIGSVYTGFDESKRKRLFDLSQHRPAECEACALRERCKNNCSCLNWKTTGKIDEVSPLVCETERMLIPIVDKLGERLYNKRAPAFIQKHYNPAYPLLSLMEDLLYVT